MPNYFHHQNINFFAVIWEIQHNDKVLLVVESSERFATTASVHPAVHWQSKKSSELSPYAPVLILQVCCWKLELSSYGSAEIIGFILFVLLRPEVTNIKSTNCTVLESHKGDRKELTIHSTNLHKLLLTPRVKSKISWNKDIVSLVRCDKLRLIRTIII